MKKNLILKDKKRRYLYIKSEKKKIILKYISNNLMFDDILRQTAQKKIFAFSRNTSITRIRNRCIITNRARSIYRKFKFSRLMFRKLALKGEIPGIQKAIW